MKKMIAFILAVLIAQPAVFADEQPRFFTLRASEKGLNSHISPFFTPDDQASEALNLRFNDRFKAMAKRPIMKVYGTPESKAVNGLFRFYKSNDTKYLIAGTSTKLWVGDDDAGTFQQIGQGFTDGARWTFASYQDIAIGANGNEQPIKYDGKTQVTANTDGSRSASDLVAELGAPFAEQNTGSNLDASSWYAYKVAFYDGTNYYYSDARSNLIATGSSVRDISLTDIPLGPTGTTTRYIFRTQGQADRATLAALGNSSYALAITIANNTATTADDAIADGSLSTAFNTWISSNSATAVTPPKGKFALIHRERLWLARTPTAKSTAYYSDSFNPDYFIANDDFDIRPDDGDEITGLIEFLGILNIFKTRTIQKIYTDQVADTSWSVSAPFSFIGTPAPYSISPTPLGVFYYGREGIYRFTGQTSQLVSDAVTQEIQDILQSNVSNISGMYYKNEYHMAYTSETLGGTNNNRVLVYDVIRDAYALDSKTINSFAALDSGDDFGVLYMGDSTTAGKVYVNESTTDTLNKRLKSEFDAGTYDDARSAGDDDSGHPHLPAGSETDFWVELAWDYTIDTWSGAGATINALRDTFTAAIIDRPDTGGTWTSEVYRVDAQSASKLIWNEELGSAGDITWAIRFCDDSACSGEAFAGTYTNPAGSDLTGETANTYVQLKATLTTSDITVTPKLLTRNGFVVKLFYSKASATTESSVLSLWDSGWKDFGAPFHEKHVYRMDVFYTGTAGTVNIAYNNIEGDVEKDFDISMTTDPATSTSDEYYGSDDVKVYRHWTGYNTASDPSAIGHSWRFVISENSTSSDFKIHKVDVWYFLQELPK